jgi:hypothetical protein
MEVQLRLHAQRASFVIALFLDRFAAAAKGRRKTSWLIDGISHRLAIDHSYDAHGSCASHAEVIELTTEMDRVAAVIVAAGRGERAGDPSEGPKQYRQIGNAPVLAHALLPFIAHEQIDDIVVVIHPDDEDVFTQTVQPHLGGADIKIVFGDRTRQMSVRRIEPVARRFPPTTVSPTTHPSPNGPTSLSGSSKAPRRTSN